MFFGKEILLRRIDYYIKLVIFKFFLVRVVEFEIV